MSDTILALFRDETRRSDVGLKARERAKSDFGKDKIVGEYLALYEELL
jgi:glycosyltransferase involved in cell wall biosynthesis